MRTSWFYEDKDPEGVPKRIGWQALAEDTEEEEEEEESEEYSDEESEEASSVRPSTVLCCCGGVWVCVRRCFFHLVLGAA